MDGMGWQWYGWDLSSRFNVSPLQMQPTQESLQLLLMLVIATVGMRTEHLLTFCQKVAWRCGVGSFVHVRWFLYILWMCHDLHTWSGWWFQTFFMFTPTWGDDPIFTTIFQMGWNHQLADDGQSQASFFFDFDALFAIEKSMFLVSQCHSAMSALWWDELSDAGLKLNQDKGAFGHFVMPAVLTCFSEWFHFPWRWRCDSSCGSISKDPKD